MPNAPAQDSKPTLPNELDTALVSNALGIKSISASGKDWKAAGEGIAKDGLSVNFTNAFTQLAKGRQKQYGYTPYFLTEPSRFLPEEYPLVQAGLDDIVLSLMANKGTAGITSGITGKVKIIDPATNPILEESIIHEGLHAKFHNMSSKESKSKMAESIKLFGSEEKHRKFLEDLRANVGMADDPTYALQQSKYIPGSTKRLSEEVLATLLGKLAMGQSKEGFEEAIKELHPNAVKWFDLYTAPSKKGK